MDLALNVAQLLEAEDGIEELCYGVRFAPVGNV